MDAEWLKEELNRLKSRKLLLVYFVFATVLMVYQHSQGWAWDFSVYSLNGQYLFHEQVYMEWKRPPMLPAILGSLQYLFSMKMAEYVFVVLNSVFFFFSSLRFSRVYDLNPAYLYVLVMSPYIVFYAALEGTELLFLSFLTLMLSEIRRPRAGAFFGLAFLTRYTAGLFVILFLFQKNAKKIIQSLLLSGLIVLPWLAFNYFALGHPFGSIADSYALDVVERGLTTPFNPEDVLFMTGLSIPFALLYIKQRDLDLADFMFIFTSALIIIRQIGTQVKVRRYLFDLSLPVAVLAAKGLNITENSKKIFYAITAIYMIAGVVLVGGSASLANPGPFQEASNEVGYCKTVSNRWPMLSYAGTPAGPLEKQFKSEEQYIEEGFKIVKFKDGNYTVKGDECIREPFNSTYLERLDQVYSADICAYTPVKTCKIEQSLSEALK